MPADITAPPLPSSERAGPERNAAAGMALFHVARYGGLEEAGEEAEADGRARALLERLRRRARERQLQKQQPQQEPPQQEPAEEAPQTAQAAGKRRRRPRRTRRREGGGTPGNPQMLPGKRRKTDSENAGAGGDARGRVEQGEGRGVRPGIRSCVGLTHRRGSASPA